MKKAIGSMSKEELRQYKKDWYNTNKQSVQLSRIVKGLKEGTRQITENTLKKYNLSVDKDGKVVIPQKQKIRFTQDDVGKPKDNVIKVVIKKDIDKIQHYNLTNTKFTAGNLTDFIATILPKLDNPPLSQSVLNAYARLPKALFEMYGEPYDADKDITEWMTNAPLFIKAIADKKAWKSDATKGKALGQYLRLAEDFKPYKDALSTTNKQLLEAKNNDWLQSATAIQTAKTQSTPLFQFDIIKEEVLKVHRKFSYQYLYYALYDIIIPRDDLNSLKMVYNINDMTDPATNYMFIDKANKTGELVMKSYKTKGVYKTKTYVLTSEIIDIIDDLHSKQPQPVLKLFPEINTPKLTSWVPKITNTIDSLNKDSIGIVYLRHSKISTELLKLKNSSVKDRAAKMIALANISMNSVKSQQGSYISPLKKLNGKPFITPKQLQQANEAVKNDVMTYFLRSKKK